MKLYLGQKRKRQVAFGLIGLICGILIWWAQICDPLQEEKGDLSTEFERLTRERDRSIRDMKEVTAYIESHKAVEKEMVRFDALKIDGKTLEELSAGTQSILQQFLDKNAIPIKAYKDLPASKWRDHPISRVELQVETGMQGVSDLLEYLETLNKVIRVERFSVSYRRKKDADLQISLQIATLQMEGIKP
ncbi:MAG: hypothetical protein HY881_11755 [Deltaproteobacteria bacterium]|nr:hypothetical protein [Deltaproteobacteria bacterium]